MVISILEADVDAARTAELEQAYREGTAVLPPEIVETFLVRDRSVPTRHRIITVWSSLAALEAMRASGVTPKGVQIFRSVDAAPELAVCEVVTHVTR